MECPLSKEELLELVEEEARLRVSADFLNEVEVEEREGKTDGTVAIQRMQEELVKRHGHPVEMVEVLRTARIWYPGVQQFWDLPIQVKHNIMSEGALSPGDILPDLSLVSLDGSVVKLRKTGMQVILASSYSCPPLRSFLPIWNKLAANHSSEEVVFTFVYIREAHANDEWPSPSSRDQPQGKVIDIPSHSSLEDRIEVARRMKEEMEIDSRVEVLVDGIEDSFNKEFAAWPIRYFITKEGRLLHKTENSIDNDLFDQDSLQNFFRGFGFVRAHVPNVTEPFKEEGYVWQNPNYEGGVRVRTRMAHPSSIGLLLCCSPCICIAVPCFFCVDKIREKIKGN